MQRIEEEEEEEEQPKSDKPVRDDGGEEEEDKEALVSTAGQGLRRKGSLQQGCILALRRMSGSSKST